MAEELLKSGLFEGAAYHSHQAGEKALKAPRLRRGELGMIEEKPRNAVSRLTSRRKG